MKQIHADDDDYVVHKNEKLKYLGYYFTKDKSYMLQHGRLHREISRPDFKEKVYQNLIRLITLIPNKLDGIDMKSKIIIENI
jgi:hypothetical protein